MDGALFGLSYVFQLAGLATKPSPHRWLFFLPILVLCTLSYQYTIAPETASGLILGSFDYLVLTNAQEELRLVGQRYPITNESLWERIKWGFKLIVSVRGVGWTHEPKECIPPHPSKKTTRTEFVVNRLAWLLFYCLLLDIGQLSIRSNPAWLKGYPGMETYSLWLRAKITIEFLVTSASFLTMLLNLLPAIITVAVGICEPYDWPHFYGSFTNAYTVRNFWSRTWHQVLRRTFASHGKYLAHNILRLQHGSIASNYIQLLVAFSLSGLIHTRTLSDSGAFRFFFLQANAIIAEEAIISAVKNLGLGSFRKTGRCLGYLWVAGWLLWSFPSFWNHMRETGMFDQKVGISLISGIREGDWFMRNYTTQVI